MAKRKAVKPGEREVKLDCQQRLLILAALPERESYAVLRLMRQLRERLALSEEEMQKMGLQSSPDGRIVQWRNPGPVRRFVFSQFEWNTIVAALRRLDQERNLTDRYIELWEMFVEAPPTPTPSDASSDAGSDADTG
jgi:hypothetical protein